MKKSLCILVMLGTIVSANNWEKINLEKDSFTGKETIGFVNTSDARGKYGENIKLIIRCGAKENPEIMVDWNTFLHTQKVQMLERMIGYNQTREDRISRINSEAQTKLQDIGSDLLETGNYYRVSKDFTAMFYPEFKDYYDSEDNELNLKGKLYDLTTHKVLVLKIAPYKDNPITAKFNLEGLNELILPYKDLCKLPDAKERLQMSERRVEKAMKLLAH